MKLSIITPTHNPKHLAETWASVRGQTHDDWEWVIVPNDKDGRRAVVDSYVLTIQRMIEGDTRVRVEPDYTRFHGIGQRKHTAFVKGAGEALIELDHDDLLTPNALEEIAAAFVDPKIGFVYSDFADFEHGAEGQGNPDTYRGAARPGWVNNGFVFYSEYVPGVRRGTYECVRMFPPSAAAVSLIYWAPNHVRAWRKSVYLETGGHDVSMKVADDHELILRTYAATTFHHIPRPLYLYRVGGGNTWAQNTEMIRELTFKSRNEHLEAIILQECRELGLPAYDLGGAFNQRIGWKTVDMEGEVDVKADLRGRWPWEDNSVGAFRAADFLEHLPDKQNSVKEIWRCLRPGGWLLSLTPSTDGRGADMDPTHVSRWNEFSWWYWTRRDQAQYIRNTEIRFQEHQLGTEFPSDWHRANNISYVRASLVALKPGYEGPGEKYI